MAKESTSGEQQLYKERTNLELFEYVNASLRNEETFHFFSFEFLRRLNIVRLQNDLIAFKEDIFRDPNSAFDNDKLTKLLESYSECVSKSMHLSSLNMSDWGSNGNSRL